MNTYICKKYSYMFGYRYENGCTYIYIYVYARPRMKRYEQVSGLVKEVFTQKSFYREKPLRTKTFTQRVHRKVFTHRNFDAQMPLWRAETFTQRNLYTTFTQKSTQAHLHTKAFAHRNFYKHIFFHREVFIQKNFHPQTLLHTKPLRTKNALRNFCASHLCVSICPPLRFNLSILSEI